MTPRRAGRGPAVGARTVLPWMRADRAAAAVASHPGAVDLVRPRRGAPPRALPLGAGRHDAAYLGVAAHEPGTGPADPGARRLRAARAGAAGLPPLGRGRRRAP